MRHGNRTDANHKQICAELRRAGVAFRDMTGLLGFGCDLIVFFPRHAYVEIKNEKTREHLTESEITLRDWCYEVGVTYLVATTSEEILTALGRL